MSPIRYLLLHSFLLSLVLSGSGAESVTLRETIANSAFHDARSGPVLIRGTATNAAVLVRVTTSDGRSFANTIPVSAGRFTARFPSEFSNAPPLAPGMVFIDATGSPDFNAHHPGHYQAEIGVIVHSTVGSAPSLPSAFTASLHDSSGKDHDSAQWSIVRNLANHYMRSRAAKLVHVGRPDFDLAREQDLAWFKDNLSLYEFDDRDRDWSKPLGARVARTFWQAVWDTWFNGSNNHPQDGDSANRSWQNYVPYTFANDFADVLIMEWMRPIDQRALCRDAVRNLLAMQHRSGRNFALPEASGKRETYTAGAFRYGMFENGEFMTEGKGWFYNPRHRDFEHGGVFNGRALWALGESLRHDPGSPLANEISNAIALALQFCLNPGTPGGYVKRTRNGNLYWRDAGEHAYLLLGMLAALEAVPELPVSLKQGAAPAPLRTICIDSLNALVDLEGGNRKWTRYPNVDSVAIAALAYGAQLLPQESDAATWRKCALRVADAWLDAKVDSREWAGDPVHFGLRDAPGRMTYTWPARRNPQFFYYQSGHWIHALAGVYALTRDERYRRRAEAIVSDFCGNNPWQVRLLNELGGVYNWSDDIDRDGRPDLLKQDMYPESTAFVQIGIMHLWKAVYSAHR